MQGTCKVRWEVSLRCYSKSLRILTLGSFSGNPREKTINKDNTELSKQVHRVGFHFPAEIVQRALTSLGIDLDKEDAVLRKHEIWPKDEPKRGRGGNRNANLMKRNGKPQLQKGLNLLQMTQEEVDAQAKAAILDMFPAVPHENLYQIILHSFELV